jgi:hypothetical protein
MTTVMNQSSNAITATRSMNPINELPISFNLRYPVLWLGLILSLVCAFVIGYSAVDRTESIKVGLQTLAVGLTITGLFYTAFNLHTLNDNYNKNLNRECLKQANELISTWEKSTDLTVVSHRIERLSEAKSPLEIHQVIKENSTDPSKVTGEKAIVFVLNFFEKLALNVELGLADETMLKKYFKALMLKYYYTFHKYIESKRQERKDESLFEKFTALASRWNQS